ncbi:c-type cytochrome [Oleiagrimonas soli]|uniref:Cytochrome c553 n=1 Tax=Oleiagrimonas soli TaxID=1543381 RepID=A0A099CTH1_9GAMM|nr:c-type cytochrome [Oleiagrimonas soli]KGI76922.1 cytochrome C553 [Oleiagrimonas soli]MBB6185214.1 cytochrome c553 [Oleiagrimonas soli]
MKAFPLWAALLLAAPVAAQAGAATPPPQLGMCAACHGEHGIAVVPGAPNLAAQRVDYLLDAMHQYRDGRRDVAVMRAALGPLSEAQLKALATWFAAQPPASPQTEASP